LALSPVEEFLKYASTTSVKAHTRRSDGKTVSVKQHSREVDDADPPKFPPHLEDLSDKKAREIEMWRKWKSGGMRPEDLQPLLRSFRPLIQSKVNVYKGKVKMIPDSAIEAEFQIRFVESLRSYNPQKGSLSTYIYRYLDKAKRFIVENQNVGRIPENRIYKIRKFTSARDDLNDELGNPPTTDDLAKRLNWSKKEVERMEAELRNDLLTQGFEEDPYSLVPSKSEEVLRLFKYELSDKERDVYEYLTGYGKPQVTSTAKIAKEVGIPDYQVSRIKNSIQKKLKRYLVD
jgi:DNA-directed RNA polymerase specialized sigma subunit